MEQEYKFIQDMQKRNPSVGVDTRAVYSAMNGNAGYAGIMSIDPEARIRDAAYYLNMPMIGDDKDPANQHQQKQDVADLQALMRERGAQVQAARDAEVKAGSPTPVKSPLLTAAAAAAAVATAATAATTTKTHSAPPPGAGLFKAMVWDIQHWNTVPDRSLLDKCHRVLCRNNRVWLWVTFILFIFVIVVLARCFSGDG